MVGKVVIETDVFSISYNDLYDDLLPIEERERFGSFAEKVFIRQQHYLVYITVM